MQPNSPSYSNWWRRLWVTGASGCLGLPLAGPLAGDDMVQLLHQDEGVGYVKNVCFAARPAAIRVQVDSPPLVDEPPAHHVRFFSMTAGGQPLRMPRRRSRLAD